MSGRDSPGQEQREIPGPVRIDLAGPTTGPCLAEPVQRGSRERFLVLFGNRFLVLFGNRTLLKCTFIHLKVNFIQRKIQTDNNIDVKGE